MKKKWLRLAGALVLLFLLYLGFVLGYGTATDYQPEAVLPAEVRQQSQVSEIQDSVLSFVTWNLGYGGLGAEADFFYGHSIWLSLGHMIRPDKDLSAKFREGIVNFPTTLPADFYLFQEIDAGSKRGYFADHVRLIGEKLPGFYAGYFPNYVVKRVPVPLLEPWQAYGKVNSGIATYSRFEPVESKRLQLPGQFSWPTRLFMLDRCLGLTRYPVKNGVQLVVINLHNEAYDTDASLKTQQLAFFKEIAIREYAAGNYVVCGGDWNQAPPFFRFNSFAPVQRAKNIDPDLFPPEWHWVYDTTVPTSRSIAQPYVEGETTLTLIDFFLISPNIRIKGIRGINQGFQFSDHQPVWMEIALE